MRSDRYRGNKAWKTRGGTCGFERARSVAEGLRQGDGSPARGAAGPDINSAAPGSAPLSGTPSPGSPGAPDGRAPAVDAPAAARCDPDAAPPAAPLRPAPRAACGTSTS